jgi:hypothetical protein
MKDGVAETNTKNLVTVAEHLTLLEIYLNTVGHFLQQLL